MVGDKSIRFTGGEYREHAAFWKRKLSLVKRDLAFRPGSNRPAPLTDEPGVFTFYLDKETCEMIDAFARGQALGTFVLLLSGLCLTLSRYAGSSVISVKTPLLRVQESGERFTDAVNIIEDVRDDLTIRQLISNVKETVAQSYRYQNYPPEIALDERELDLKTAANILIYSPQLHDAPERIERYDLIIQVVKDGTAIRMECAYNRRHFDRPYIRSLARALQAALKSYKNLETRLDRVSLLSAEQRERVLVGFNRTEADYPSDKLAHELIEEQARKTPERIAVRFEERELTYAELDRQADQLARHLQRRFQVKPDDLIGIMLRRSERMVVAMLGILKSGAAYAPIDPGYPGDRIGYMLSDSGIKALITETEYVKGLESFEAKTLDLDADPWSLEPPGGLERMSDPENLAYVIYTSGSTGRPKGVQIPHRAVVNFLHSMKKSPGITEQDVLLAVTPVSFDIAALELLLPLTVGARVVVASRAESYDAELLAKRLAASGATIMQATPATWRMLVDSGWKRRIKMLCGGESLPANLAARMAAAGQSLWNLYGPTETTIWSSAARIKNAQGAITIGKPIANTTIYLLDKNLEPVPIGLAGELYIGGHGLARGYLNSPDLTAERFIPDPFSKLPGARLYRTGDLARYLDRGEIEALGRSDHQIKIRGHRIEPGEIESALEQHPGVRQAVVTALQVDGEDKRLVAYCVLDGGNPPSAGDLRKYVRAKLPDYMTPAAFIALNSLPLTPNGKIDKKALPAPDWSRLLAGDSFVAPRTFVEETLAAIWSRALGVEQVGIDDNFFALGGDSMRGVKIAALAREKGLQFNLQDLFQRQTIRALALAIESTGEESATGGMRTEPFSLVSDADRLLLPEDSLEDAYPLTMLQAGMIFEQELNPETAVYHQIISFHLRVPFDHAALNKAIRGVVTRHPALRASIRLSRFSEPLQLIHRQVDAPAEVEDLRALPAPEQDAAIAGWIEAERRRRFDWERPPLLRFKIHRRADDSLQFTISAPHALLDGWSVGLLLTELFNRYTSLLDGRAMTEEPPIAGSFRDYVAAERIALASEESRRFWDGKLSGATVTEAPRLRPARARIGARRFETVLAPISPELSGKLSDLARRLSVPLKSVLLASHVRAISLLAGQTDVVTGVVTNARLEAADSERLIGLCLNTLPLRMVLKGGTWKDLINATFEAEREMLPHRRYPMAQLQRNAGQPRLFETGFNFTNFHVYEGMREDRGVDLLGGSGIVETDFALMAAFDLNLGSKRIQLNLHCDTAELDHSQLEAISGYYSRILNLMADEPDSSYERAEILSPEERRRVTEEWNRTASRYPTEKLIHDLVSDQARLRPEKAAIRSAKRNVTYRELEEESNRLARYLMKKGIGPEDLVGVCLDRGAEMIIAMLGTLKAGAAYAPMNPTYPAERLVSMIEDAKIRIALTERGLFGELSERLGDEKAGLICVDDCREEMGRESGAPVTSAVTDRNLAYVIYTSGSTGRPKGVGIEHRSLLNLVYWHNRAYQVTPDDRATQVASPGFDASVWEIWPYLAAGASLYIADEEIRAEPDRLRDWMIGEGVTTAFMPTPLAESVAGEKWPEESRLKYLLTGGDRLRVRPSPDNSFKLVNHYGPTENTVVASSCVVEAVDENGRAPAIGRPISNVQIYLLDEHGQIAPVGTPGELCIGGDGLARGYLNRPELTAEKFIPNPFSQQPGQRLYRTGDLCRYLPGGEIEFIGRKDNQVKIRGFRIELGEIEKTLTEQPGVKEAVVEARESRNGEKRLVAYVVSDGGRIDRGELRRRVGERLPEYMRPSAYVEMDELPVTANGKIDRKRLPEKEEEERLYVEPGNEVERAVAEIWAEALGVERVGVEDDFFELGGHSLMAARVIARIKDALGVDLPMRNLYLRPTVRNLAAIIEERKRASGPSEMEKIASLLDTIDQMTLDEAKRLLGQTTL